ncbi:uncharacterized protein MKK02DRAFT_41834 [Dioszegia hungarica]|uniref:Uncharacterized protein n=1 Tax=Dioszegia hungarica TaxID=4972 RepID=A0AA38HCZ9_9TREE|nr:uncharacterized protein MKK02DRAFT_41834 [Dioszegia hungarica]KAI9638807.1 hypothetical protein MKK02DRAFT_41834 [Dioszegia hungarica]
MSGAPPPAKRARSDTTAGVTSADLPKITSSDLARIPHASVPKLLAALLEFHPANATLISSFIPPAPIIKPYVPPPPPPPPVRKNRPILKFSHFVEEFTEIINKYHPPRKEAKAAQAAFEEVGGMIISILEDCDENESDHYETRKNAFETLIELAEAALYNAEDEGLMAKILNDLFNDPISEGLGDLMEIIEGKGEVERLSKDGGKSKVRRLQDSYVLAGCSDEAFDFLLEAFDIVEGEDSEDDEAE